MAENRKALLKNAFKVTLHWVAFTLVVGLVLLIKQDPNVLDQFTQFLKEFGIPMYLVNIIIAGGVKLLERKAAQLQD